MVRSPSRTTSLLGFVVTVALLMSACSTTGETASTPDAAAVPPSSTTSPPDGIGGASESVTWSRVAHDEDILGGGGEQQMNGVVAGGPGLVAVGSDESGGDQDAAVWTSSDGVNWSRVAHDEAVLGGEGPQRMLSVTASGQGVVAVGAGSNGSDGPVDGMVWTSPDGLEWSRVPHDEAVFGGDGVEEILSVAAGGPGFVAVGTELPPSDAVVWVSPDGFSWSRISDDLGVMSGDGNQSSWGVASGPRLLVNVGRDEFAGTWGAAVWTSPDGVAWSRVPDDESVLGARDVLISVIAGGPGFVAVGAYDADSDRDAAVWVSSDGVTWSRIAHDADVFGGAGIQSMAAAASGATGFVAVGWDESGGFSDAAAWTSPDGVRWSRVPHNEGVFGGERDQEMLSVTAGGPGFVAVGLDGSSGSVDFDAAVWIGTLEG